VPLAHGLGFSPDHRTLAVVSIGSNSVTLVDTATNRVKGIVYVGRSPHEPAFTADGRELWVAVRGEDYVSVIDPSRLKEVRRVPTANGPGMIQFEPNGRFALVPSSFTPELDVIDVARHEVVARVEQASPFSPNLAVSPDGKEVWFTLKDTGKVQVIAAEPPFATLTVLDTGPVTNHVAMVDDADGHFAYVTVGGLDHVKVYRRNGAEPQFVTSIPTGSLPHGIWPSRCDPDLRRPGERGPGAGDRHAGQAGCRHGPDRPVAPGRGLRPGGGAFRNPRRGAQAAAGGVARPGRQARLPWRVCIDSQRDGRGPHDRAHRPVATHMHRPRTRSRV
jgi:YVTN family beta-propeller protein